MDAAHLSLAFLAGLTSILSPCVLPLAPIVVTTALSKHRLGAIALACGLALSFTVIGLFVAVIGFSLGLDEALIRVAGAVLLTTVGIILIVPPFQARLVLVMGPVSAWMEQRFSDQVGGGLAGQFGIGLLLGAVWAPCAGPSLGAAVALAAQGRDLLQVAATMLVFSAGTVLPLAVLGTLSRPALARWRDNLLAAGSKGKILLGGILIVNSLLILSGLDKTLETALVDHLPQWLLEMAARY